jgi:hypothetical protein
MVFPRKVWRAVPIYYTMVRAEVDHPLQLTCWQLLILYFPLIYPDAFLIIYFAT